MKKIENKKTAVKNKFTQYCRAALLSLFVMLMIPSISSDIFGNGDAEAGCIEKSGYIGSTITFSNAMAQHASFCFSAGTSGYTGAAGSNHICDQTFIINRIDYCESATDTCTAKANATIRCSQLSNTQCNSGVGDIAVKCRWAAEDTDNNKLVDAVCRVYLIATGTAGKAFAAVGVISVGIGFFTGKVSWGLMISVAAGIAVFFGAPSIIGVISGSDASNLCSQVGNTN